MTSAINYLAINENFPVAGQDNDTQVFRDNFDTIKTNFRLAKEEITDLQDTSARTNTDNSFQNKLISEAIFVYNKDKAVDAGFRTTNITVDYQEASYHIFTIGADIDIEFLNLPTNNDQTSPLGVGVGKITLELYSDGTARNITLSVSAGTIIRSNSFPLSKIGDSQQPIVLPSNARKTSNGPIIVEIWRHNSDTLFTKYLGQFS